MKRWKTSTGGSWLEVAVKRCRRDKIKKNYHRWGLHWENPDENIGMVLKRICCRGPKCLIKDSFCAGPKCAKATYERLLPLHECDQAHGDYHSFIWTPSSKLLHLTMMIMKVRKENPDASIGEVAKILGKMWGEIEPADKAKFDKVPMLILRMTK